MNREVDEVLEFFMLMDLNNPEDIEGFNKLVEELDNDIKNNENFKELKNLLNKILKKGKITKEEEKKISNLLESLQKEKKRRENTDINYNGDNKEEFGYNEEILEMFIEETEEFINKIEEISLTFQNEDINKDIINKLFRYVHNIKGSVAIFKLKYATDFLHRLEDFLDKFRKGKLEKNPLLEEILLDSVDLLREILNTIRLYLDKKIDNLVLKKEYFQDIINKIGNYEKNKNFDTPKKIKEVDNLDLLSNKDIKKNKNIKIKSSKIDYLIDMIGELVIIENMLFSSKDLVKNKTIEKNLLQLKRIVSNLQEISLKLRMVPISDIRNKLERVVRDVSKATGKKVQFVIKGGDIEIDRNILEELVSPLIHLLRNSCDHGIELPEDRKKKGKSEVGRIELYSYYKGKNIVIEIKDDGAGLDKDKILQQAREKRIIQEDEKLNDEAIYNLIFQPGFSTAKKVTSISGRGVGMDVVANVISKLMGKIEIETEKDKGTLFRIILPLTLSIIDGVIIRAGDEKFIIPSKVVKFTLKYELDNIKSIGGKEVFFYENKTYRLVDLKKEFNIPDKYNESKQKVVLITEGKFDDIALIIDEIIDKQEIVIKDLGILFKNIKSIGGGAILDNGRVGLIIDVYEL